MRKTLIFFALYSYLLLATTETHAAEKITLQLRWHHGFQFAGYYMAKEKGFFEQENLNVSFLEGGAGINHFDQISQGKADFGIAGSALAMEYLKGRRIKSIAAIFQHSPYALMVRKSSGYNNPQQLRGKKIYIPLTPRTAEIQAMFINEGVSIDNIIAVNPLRVERNFADDNIDAFSVYITNGPFQAQQAGIQTRLIRPINYGIDFYGDCLFAQSDYIQENLATVEKFKQAIIQGWSYAFEHPEETIDIVLDKYNTDHRSREHIIFEYEKMKELILPDHIPIGQQNPQRWDKIAETYLRLGMAPEGKNVKSLVFDPKTEHLEKVARRHMIFYGVVILALLSIVVLFLWSMLLKRKVAIKTEHLKNEIDDHKLTQNELRLALDKYKTLFTAFPHGISVSDSNGNIIETNRVAETLLGVSKEDHEQRSIDEEIWRIIRSDGTDMPSDEWASVKALKENRIVSDCEMGIYRSKNEITWLNVTAAPLPIINYGVVVTYSDITARKLLQDHLYLHEAIVSSVFEPMAVIDNNYDFMLVNKAYEDFWGIEKEDIIGKQVSETMGADKFESGVKQYLDRCLAGETVSYGSWFESPIKGRRYMQLHYYPHKNEKGDILGLINIAYDLTDNFESQELLKQQKLMLSRTESNAHIGSWQWEIATDTVTWSDELFKILKRDTNLAEPSFSELLQLYIPGDMTRLEQLVKRAIENAEPYEAELQVMRSDGVIRRCLTQGYPEKDTEGKVVRLFGFLQDITEKHAAVMEIKQLAHDQSVILNNVPAYIYFKDTENNILRISQSVADITGLPREDIEGHHSSEIYPDMADQYWADDLEVIKSKKSKLGIVEPLPVEKGDPRWLLTDKIPVFGEGDKVIGVIVMASDITERIIAEKQVKESEEYHRKLLAMLPYGIQLTDRDGKILFSNPAHHRIQGYDDGELVGRYIWDLMVDENQKSKAKDYYKKIIKDQPRPDVYFNHDITKDGREIDVQINWDYIRDSNGRIESIISVISDITQQKALEASVWQAQKMKSIGNLAGGIAHDFNNILTPIVGMSEMLIEDLPPGSDERESAREIFKAGKRGSDLVKQILTFSRQSEHIMRPTRIQKVLKEVIKLSRSVIPTYIEIKQDIQQDCDMVLADPSQIHQIAMNLVTNAYHAMENRGGNVSIQLKQTVLEPTESSQINLHAGSYAVLSVTDTGHGMSEELLGKIFDPYFTTKAQGKGTGLGLAVVFGIVKEHKGGITVTSEIGKGSTFNVYFPLMKQSTIPKTEHEPEECPGGEERILLVDDEGSIAKLEKRVLERIGYKVTAYLNSVEALEAFSADPSEFDLVITDMSMPIMPGDELARKVKSIRADVPIIACTGFSERIKEDTITQLGIDALLMKPIGKSELTKTVRQVLDEAKSENQG